jgi:hypothetical protein
LLSIALHHRQFGFDECSQLKALRVTRVPNQNYDRVQHFTDLSHLQLGLPGLGKLEKAGEQAIKPPAFLLNNVKKFPRSLFGLSLPLQ